MSKNNQATKEVVKEMPLADPQGKTVEELKEVIQTLQAQMNQEQTLLSKDQVTVHNRQAKVLKYQGALEMILQMIPKEEVEKMIAQENRSNGEVVEG